MRDRIIQVGVTITICASVAILTAMYGHARGWSAHDLLPDPYRIGRAR